MPRCHETSTYSLPMFDESDSFTNDLLKYFNSIPPNINDKQDDITSEESDCSSLITNRHQDELASMISTLETSATVTTDDKRFYIKEHESPSTSAAAIAAAEAVTFSNSKNSDTFAPSLLQQKSIFRKSSAFFNQKILGKKSSAVTMQDNKLELRESIKKKRSSGFTIKQQQQQQ
ncbi:hypothetical protein BDF21DRAFT_409742, partial [Thamnidium elegans]